MGKREKLLIQLLRGTADAAIPFEALCNLLQYLDFRVRIKGSHHIFYRKDVVEILNIQPKGSLAKPYQVKQIRDVIVKYHLGGDPHG